MQVLIFALRFSHVIRLVYFQHLGHVLYFLFFFICFLMWFDLSHMTDLIFMLFFHTQSCGFISFRFSETIHLVFTLWVFFPPQVGHVLLFISCDFLM